MTTLQPLSLAQADEALNRFFPDRVVPDRLQECGHWQGSGSRLLFLQNPVRPDMLRHLLAGCTPSGGRTLLPPDPDRVAAWQLTFTPPADLARGLNRPAAQAAAVRGALARWEDRLVQFDPAPPWEYPPQPVFAVFHEPRARQTSVWLVNAGYLADRTARTLAPATVTQAVQGLEPLYREHLAVHVRPPPMALQRTPAHAPGHSH